MPGARGVTHPDLRGNTADRRARKLYLLREFGDGERCECLWCGETLTYETVEVDRYPVCGHDGGRYVRTNIVPACRRCNAGRCATCSAAPRRSRQLARLKSSDDPEGEGVMAA